jgi:hypothetical protein
VQPLYIAPLASRWWGLSHYEPKGQRRGELTGIDPKCGRMRVDVPFKCVGAVLYDQPVGGEELGRGYADDGYTFCVFPGDEIVFTVRIG